MAGQRGGVGHQNGEDSTYKYGILDLLVLSILVLMQRERHLSFKNEKESMAGGGGQAPPPKQDELQPHPSKDQLPGISYCITGPPPWREFLSFFCF
ncbi:hypothetical protein Vadar_004252 [Vaccinium darrowii]|uniref:Uncharacterized protein n=1 Tax=Vaccinium darrowii TaxID=229202 RepID=A0ACB7YCR2_9ERIC|nr:hypothetical protein Vadar_004252 [Vaccinium darrowii]